MAVYVSRISSQSKSLAASCDKAFVVGPGHMPFPVKLVKEITSGKFVELVYLLSANLHAVNEDPQSFLDGKVLVSMKRCL